MRAGIAPEGRPRPDAILGGHRVALMPLVGVLSHVPRHGPNQPGSSKTHVNRPLTHHGYPTTLRGVMEAEVRTQGGSIWVKAYEGYLYSTSAGGQVTTALDVQGFGLEVNQVVYAVEVIQDVSEATAQPALTIEHWEGGRTLPTRFRQTTTPPINAQDLSAGLTFKGATTGTAILPFFQPKLIIEDSSVNNAQAGVQVIVWAGGKPIG